MALGVVPDSIACWLRTFRPWFNFVGYSLWPFNKDEPPLKGVMNGPLKFLTARKILPLLDLLAKFKRVLACSCSPNFCSCSHARSLVNPSLG